MGKLKYNWQEIQIYYDDNHTWRDLKLKYGMADATIHKACKTGKIKLRCKSDAILLHHKLYGAPKHTKETKKLLSDIRIKYLDENPDKVPWLINHSSKKSNLEIIFENALISSNIFGWKYHYQNGRYEYDFAFIDKKIDVEIDGSQHLSEKQKIRDERRDKFSRENGWKVIRFSSIRVRTDIIGCINELKSVIDNLD